MKKLLLIAALAATGTSAFAQARPGGELSSKDYTGGGTTGSRNTGFGLKVGYNYSDLYGDGTKGLDFSGTNAFHAGAYGQFGFNEFASVQVEILYSRKGVDGFGTSGGTLPATRSDRRLNYLQVPILFVGNVTETLSFHVGPHVSLLTSVQEGDNDVAIASSGYNSLDYGALAGVEARLGPARLGARYDLGLGKVFDSTRISDRVSNSTLQVYVGFGFTQ